MGAPRDEAHSFFEYAVALSHAKLDCDVKKRLEGYDFDNYFVPLPSQRSRRTIGAIGFACQLKTNLIRNKAFYEKIFFSSPISYPLPHYDGPGQANASSQDGHYEA